MKLMMKLIVVAVLILFGIGIYFYLLPNEQSKTIERTLKFNRAKIWKKIRDIENQKDWRKEIENIKMIETDYGKEVWIEKLKQGNEIKLKTSRLKEEEVWEIQSIENQLFETSWKGSLESISENETKLVFTENFSMRNFFSKFIFYSFMNLEKMIDEYFIQLEKSLEISK
jgi:hypothetical protein